MQHFSDSPTNCLAPSSVLARSCTSVPPAACTRSFSLGSILSKLGVMCTGIPATRDGTQTFLRYSCLVWGGTIASSTVHRTHAWLIVTHMPGLEYTCLQA
eukprot:scaffold305143_cov17-Tisochrysis_lutea.AAC.1